MTAQYLTTKELKAGMELLHHGAKILVLNDPQLSEGHREWTPSKYGDVYYCKGVVLEASPSETLLKAGREWPLQGNDLMKYRAA